MQIEPPKVSLVSGVINEVQVAGGSKFQILDIILVKRLNLRFAFFLTYA